MGQTALVEMQINDGVGILKALHRAKFDVAAAAWILAAGEDRWYLYVASSDVDRLGGMAAYRAIHPVVQQEKTAWVDQFDIKLIEADSPIAQDLRAIQSKYPAPIATRYHGPRLGHLSVDEAYIYPISAQVTKC